MDLDGLVAVRTIHLLSSALAAGALMFASIVAEPAFRSVSDSGPALADRFRKWAARLVYFALGLALLSGAAWLVLLARRIGDDPGLAETTWTLLTQTQFGAVWQLRFACAIVLAALLFASMRRGPQRSVFHGAAVVGAVFVGTLAWSGHGGATPGNTGTVHTAADILHLIAAAAWIGGLVPLVMLLRLALRTADERWRMVTAHVLRGFSNFAVVSVAIILITGIVNVWMLVDGIDALTGSYGRLLLLKIALFVGMLGFAAVNRLRLMPGVAAHDAGETEQALRRIARNAGAEIALGVAIFIIVGFLGIMAPSPHNVHMH
jgi:putative copper resistance protein D